MPSGCELRRFRWMGLFGSRMSVSLLDEHRVDHGRGHRRVAQDVLLDARRLHHLAVEVDERLPVGEEERRVGPDLPPDEHVLRRQRDLPVAVGDVGPYRLQDALPSAGRSAGSGRARRTGSGARSRSSSRPPRTSSACPGRAARARPSGGRPPRAAAGRRRRWPGGRGRSSPPTRSGRRSRSRSRGARTSWSA